MDEFSIKNKLSLKYFYFEPLDLYSNANNRNTTYIDASKENVSKLIAI